MKGLACCALAVVLCGCAAVAAGSLETSLGAGFTSLSLGDVNASIGAIDSVLANWNLTPTLDGGVPPLGPMQAGASYSAGERFWVLDNLALGGTIETFRASSATQGSYTGGGRTAQVSISLDCRSVGLVFGAHVKLASLGVDLGADVGVGYFYSGFSTDVTFQTPSGVPPVSIRPRQGQDHYNASSLGLEGGLSLSFDVSDWLGIGAMIAYRWVGKAAMSDAAGNPLDIDGDGVTDQVDLSGVVIRLALSLTINLPQDEGGRSQP